MVQATREHIPKICARARPTPQKTLSITATRNGLSAQMHYAIPILRPACLATLKQSMADEYMKNCHRPLSRQNPIVNQSNSFSQVRNKTLLLSDSLAFGKFLFEHSLLQAK